LRFLAQNKVAKVVEFTLENTHFEIGVLKKKNLILEKKLLPQDGHFGDTLSHSSKKKNKGK
jgi:hypothetical protein